VIATSEVETAIKQYLLLLEPSNLMEGDRLRALSRALDDLAYVYHRIPEATGDLSDREPPNADYHARYSVIRTLFPSLGLYVCGSKELNNIERSTVGDMIDDLADIAADLESVVWYLDHGEENTALWHFRFSFEVHWGKHLRDASISLHELLTHHREADPEPLISGATL